MRSRSIPRCSRPSTCSTTGRFPKGCRKAPSQALARTPDGYLWVGTQEGLARFDGVRFTVFDSGNEPAIPEQAHLGRCIVDRAGRLWIGTRSGMAVLENGRFKTLQRSGASDHAYVRAIAEGKAGRMWVGTETGLFEIVDGEASRAFDMSQRAHATSRIRALTAGPRRACSGWAP